ncbi:uncharacterized protein LOC109788574 isoform X4 [Cajanus cajan]|uniref:uncharacterized protein LOC109788574 isoform X4 n=1 Tax=Cajanus cajan TaxID=3821 RepID=UPI00098D7D85|nr:uncharacterized protein LOC109788574 isoform X4 [Cajanus cajan]
MKIRFLALFLLILGIQAISTSEFNNNFTSEGKLYGNIEGSITLKDKVEETKKGYKEEGLNISRKAQGGSSGGGGKKGRSGGGGSADVNRRPRRSSAPSEPHFWISRFNNLCVSLALVIFFPFHQL